MHYPDLAPCEYFQGHPALAAAELVAVGWLEPGYPFARGQPDLALVETLVKLFGSYGRSFFAGGHACGLCLEAAGGPAAPAKALRNLPMGYKDLFLAIPNRAAFFAVPELITHYIAFHGYQPPEGLREALTWRPPVEL